MHAAALPPGPDRFEGPDNTATGTPFLAAGEVAGPAGAVADAAGPLGEARDALLRAGADRVWLTGPGGYLVGVLTDAALLRAEAAGVDPRLPAAALAEAADLAGDGRPVRAADDAADVVGRLGRGGPARLAVTDEGGLLIGEITRTDALHLVRGVRTLAGLAAPDPAPAKPAPVRKTGPAAPRFLSRPARRRATARARG